MATRRILTGTAVCLTLLSAAALAHEEAHSGHSGHSGASTHEMAAPAPSAPASAAPPVYFTYAPHRALLGAHILVMTVGWVFVMPVATMLFIAGSRYHLPVQIAFLATNGLGVALSTIYNSLTPDLYPNNAHHKMGWALVWILAAQAALGVIGTIARTASSSHWSTTEERSGFIPVPTASPGNGGESHLYRHSGDSGHGVSMEADSAHYDDLDSHEWKTAPTAKRWFDVSRFEDFLSRTAPFVFSGRAVRACDIFYSAIARFMIPLGFTQLATGIVTGSGIFTGNGVFNGLAHFIKGGIFFMYGVLVLGRWAGAFAELGWAWNLKPGSEYDSSAWRARTPSAEMVESSLIFVYGCANIFLEHLAAWGGEWTHGDLQHASISFMFIGGGLCGILVESRRVRALLNYGMTNLTARPTITTAYGADVTPTPAAEASAAQDDDAAAAFSLNPLPALVIFLLGIMMSSHHQHSQLSTTVHVQWGALLSGAAVVRVLTYLLFYRAPPTSFVPSRPPTELVTAFCLMAGGLVFMVSNRDTVNFLDAIGVDAMFSLVVTVGFTALIMSWVLGVLAIKGAALRKETKRMYATREGSSAQAV